MHGTLKEEEIKNKKITEEELKEALVKIEQETSPVPEPVAVAAAPVAAAKPNSPKVKKTPAPKATTAMKAANSEKTPPKKRGRKPAAK